MKFLNPQYKYAAAVSTAYFKIKATLFCCSFFFKEYINPQARINKMVNKYSVDCHSNPSGITSRIHLQPGVSQDGKRKFSNLCCLCFQNFQIYVSNLYWKMQFASQKIEFRHFYSCPSPGKIISQIFIIIPRAEGGY